MPDILALTAWDVPSEGFRWVDAYSFGRDVNSVVERFLVANSSQAWRRYWPLEDTPGLFRSFADLEPTEAPILDFASRYGALGITQGIEIPASKPGPKSASSDEDETFDCDFGNGERLAIWVDEIQGLKQVLRVWDALQVMDVDNLQCWFRVEDFHGALRAVYDPGEPLRRAVFTHERTPQSTVTEFQWYLSHSEIRRITEDPSTVALSFIRTVIEGRLREQVAARMVYQEQGEGGPLGVSLVPKTLLGSLWLQAAHSIEAGKAFGRCRECRGWFEVPPELLMMGRKDVGFCSVACRNVAEERGGNRDPNAAPTQGPATAPGQIVDLSKEPIITSEDLEGVEALKRASGGSR
jgi:hypothetical protein